MYLFRNLALVLVGAAALLGSSVASADGCYSCGSTSGPACKDFCRYTGKDSFAARQSCKQRGCVVVAPVACPSGEGAKICSSPPPSTKTQLAAIPWCAAPLQASI